MKAARESVQESTQHTENIMPEDPSNDDNSGTYRISAKTILAVCALSLAFATQNAQNLSILTLTYQAEAVNGLHSISWIPNAQSLVLGVLLIPFGTLGDHVGKRNLIVAGLALGIVAGLVSGRASNVDQIIGGQAIAGLSGALILLTVPAAQEVVPNRFRPIAAGVFPVFTMLINSAVAIGDAACVQFNITGPLNGWRWTYYLPVICCAISFALVLVTYRPPPSRLREGVTLRSVLVKLDYFGIVLGLAGLLLVFLGLNWGGNQYSWNSVQVICTLVIGFLTLVSFALYEWKGTAGGILQHRLFLNRNLALLLAVVFVDGIIFSGTAAYLPQEALALFSATPIQQVIPIILASVTVAIGSASSAHFFFKLRRYRLVLIGSLLWVGAVVGCAALVRPGRPSLIYVLPALWGLGLGVSTSMPNALIALSVPNDLIGTAIMLALAIRSLGGTVGVTIFSAVLSNKTGKYVPSMVGSAATGAGLSKDLIPAIIEMLTFHADPKQILALPGMTPTAFALCVDAFKSAQSMAYQYVYFAIIPFCIVAAMFSGCLLPVAERMTDHVESNLETSKPSAEEAKSIA